MHAKRHVWIQRHALYFMLRPNSTLNSTLSHRYSNTLAQHRFCPGVLLCQRGPVRPPFLGLQESFFFMNYLKPHSDRGPRFCSNLIALFGFFVCLPYPFSWLNKKYTDSGFTFDCEPCGVSEGSANNAMWYWIESMAEPCCILPSRKASDVWD